MRGADALLRGQKNSIAPWKPPDPMIGTPLTSMWCSVPVALRMTWGRCAARLARRAGVRGARSIGMGRPPSSSGPKIAVHSDALIDPVSSKRRPSRAPAASL